MPIDLSPYLSPADCAVLVFECQENVIGSESSIPGLAAAVRDGGMLGNIAALLEAARGAGARIFYCTAESRPGDVGRARTPLLDRLQRDLGASAGPVDSSVVKEIAPEAGDIRMPRSHGMSAFFDSGLDPCLRDLGTRTVIPVGVSLNIGLLGTTVEAVNRGYRVIMPADCVAADPPEYGEQILRYSIRNLAYLSTAAEIVAAWQAPA
ncbi:MAG: cysteine hydrolase [Myxococcota bacterium]